MPMRVWAKLSPSRITYRRLFKPRSTTLPRRLLLGDLGQVMHYHPPAYPSSHPILTMVGAALQSVLPPEYADASFHAGPEREGPLEPGLFFVLLALLGKTTAVRQSHAPDACPLGGLLTLLRVESAVAGQELRRTSEALAVPLDALRQVRVLAAGFFEHLIAA